MSKVRVYQFRKYDVRTDEICTSRRWGTIEGIREIGGSEFGPGVEVDKSAVEAPESDMLGLTKRGFDPHKLAGFPQSVKA